MVKTTTLADHQDAQRAADEPQTTGGSYLADLAQQMVSERQGQQADPVGDPWEHCDLAADPGEAYGHLEARLRAWLEERGVWALEAEIRRKADQLLADAEQLRPVATEATYTVGPDGLVSGYTVTEAEMELPGMPGHPEAPAAPEPVPDNTLDPALWGKVADPEVKARLLWAIPQNVDMRRGMKRADDLADMVDYLIRTVPPLRQLATVVIAWYWVPKGSRRRGKPVLTRVALADKSLAYERDVDVVVHLAADHLRKMHASALFVERLVFDALARIEAAGPSVAPDDEWTRLPGRWRYGWMGPDERLYGDLVVSVHHGSSLDVTQDVDVPEPSEDQTECLKCGGYIAPDSGRVVCLTCRPDEPVDDGAGVLIHPDGTPLTEAEIAAMEAAELADDDYLDEGDEDPG